MSGLMVFSRERPLSSNVREFHLSVGVDTILKGCLSLTL